MKGHEYANLIARYLVHNYGPRGLNVYREVSLGKTIIGKDRRIDVFAILGEERLALAIECKYQDTQGTVDEKIPYALDDLEAMRVPACVVYAGSGFSSGIIHMLQGSHLAAFCLPPDSLESTDATKELDHIVATTFRWWDLVLRNKLPIVK